MSTKIYKVIKHDVYQKDCLNSINVVVFKDQKLAQEYFHQLINETKKNEEDIDLEDYTIDEGSTNYERYLTGYATEDSLSIWIEEDEICEELKKSNDLEKDYDI